MNQLPTNTQIQYCNDGKYRWIYELKLMSNPVIMITLWKVLMLASSVPVLLVLICGLVDGDGAEAFISAGKVLLILAAILFALSFISYVIYAAINGWKYIVLFEMDEEGVVHRQQDKQFKKAEAVGWLAAFMGAASNNIGMTGTGMLAATRNEMRSEFSKVKSISAVRSQHTIKVNETLNHNQVYADGEDFDFVYNFIASRCPGAKVE